MKTEPVYLHLAEGDYVIIPRSDYVRLCGQQQPEGVPVAEARLAVMREMGRRVHLAREQESDARRAKGVVADHEHRVTVAAVRGRDADVLDMPRAGFRAVI